MKLQVATHQVQSISSIRLSCQCSKRPYSPHSQWLSAKRDDGKQRKRRMKIVTWMNQAKTLHKERRKWSPIANTLNEAFMPKVCARIVIIRQGAQNLQVAALTKSCMPRSFARIATWSTMARRKGKRIVMLKLLRVKKLSHFQLRSSRQLRIRLLRWRRPSQNALKHLTLKRLIAAIVKPVDPHLTPRPVKLKLRLTLFGKWSLQGLQSNFRAKIRSLLQSTTKYESIEAHFYINDITTSRFQKRWPSSIWKLNQSTSI